MKIDSGPERWIYIGYTVRPTITCKMNFNWYPFDSHNCDFVFLSHVPQMQLETELQGSEFGNWMRVMHNTILEFDYKFESLPITVYNLSQFGSYENERILNEVKSMGTTWTATGFRIVLKRIWIKQLFLFYLPSSLFVMASWVSFLVPPTVRIS